MRSALAMLMCCEAIVYSCGCDSRARLVLTMGFRALSWLIRPLARKARLANSRQEERNSWEDGTSILCEASLEKLCASFYASVMKVKHTSALAAAIPPRKSDHVSHVLHTTQIAQQSIEA